MKENILKKDDIKDYLLFKTEESKKSLLLNDNYKILNYRRKQMTIEDASGL